MAAIPRNTRVTHAQQQHLRDAAGRFCAFFAMLEAMVEIDGDKPIDDMASIASIMGCGASDNLTAKDFRNLRAALQTGDQGEVK